MGLSALSARQRRIVILVATLVSAALMARLGAWQLDRAAQKQAMQGMLDERSKLPALQGPELATDLDTVAAQHYRAARLRGQWLAQHTVYLENRTMNGRVGFIVVTPLTLDQGAVVMVQRGWVARDFVQRTRLPDLPTPGGMVEVQGRVAAPPSRMLDFAGAAASGPIRQNLDISEYAQETGLALRPVSIQQADDAGNRGDGLLRQWPRPAIDVHKHYGYAAQWFALAALITGLYVWFQLLRPRLHAGR
jgi:surfeit locus 1 family protein